MILKVKKYKNGKYVAFSEKHNAILCHSLSRTALVGSEEIVNDFIEKRKTDSYLQKTTTLLTENNIKQ